VKLAELPRCPEQWDVWGGVGQDLLGMALSSPVISSVALGGAYTS